jgi:hypothetical protein
MTMDAIVVRDLRRAYGPVQAVDGISFVMSCAQLGLLAAWTLAGTAVVWLRRDALTGR